MSTLQIHLTPKAFTFVDCEGGMVMYPTSELTQVQFISRKVSRYKYAISFHFTTGTHSFSTDDKEKYLGLRRAVEKHLNEKCEGDYRELFF